MRNIEEIATEEDSRARQVLRSRLNFIFRTSGLGLSLWGWFLFQRGEMGKGALLVTAAFILWAISWGILQAFRGTFPAIFAGLFAFAFAFTLYFLTRLPSFYWGSDPAFWLSVHAGAVNEPPWSPLSYLLGQAACFLLPALQFSILPILSGLVLAVAFYFLAQEYFSQLKNKSFLGLAWVILVCAALAVSAPFWDNGTLGSGLTASLGFLLVVFQRVLLEHEERPWKALYFIQGLFWSVHPLWGLLGLFCQLGSMDLDGKIMKNNLPPLLAGLTPYLWLPLRVGRFFPSWGGEHPFAQWLGGGWKNIEPIASPDGFLLPGLSALGWTTALLAVLVALLWFFNFFKWKSGWKIQFSSLDFWVWAAAGLGCLLFYSPSAGAPGLTSLWFAAGLGGSLLKLLEKGAERRQGTFFSSRALAWTGTAGLALALGLAWLPGQGPLQRPPYFPQQHALNLLKTLNPKAMLICKDPFDAAACREARLMEPMALEAIILDEPYLDQRWYAAQVMAQDSEILFSDITGPPVEVLKRIVLANRDLWDIHWDLSQLPLDWKGPPAAPTVLTQEFGGPVTNRFDSEKAQYQFDLTALPEAGKNQGRRSYEYFSRYVSGFDELGKYLMGLGRYSAAIHAFERSVKLDPSFQEPQNYLALMYSKQNILEAARLEFEKTVKTKPQEISALLKQLSDAENSKDESKTVALLDEMIHLNSDLADAEYQLSKIYDQEGRAQESKALLESSVNLNPQQLEAQMTLGKLMARMGNRIKAEEAFRAVLEIDPQNKEAQVQIWKLLNKP